MVYGKIIRYTSSICLCYVSYSGALPQTAYQALNPPLTLIFNKNLKQVGGWFYA